MSSMGITLALHEERLGQLRGDVNELEEQQGAIMRELSEIRSVQREQAKDLTRLATSCEQLVEHYYSEHPSKVGTIAPPSKRGILSSGEVKIGALVTALVTAVQVIAELVRHVLP